MLVMLVEERAGNVVATPSRRNAALELSGTGPS
jgi:hypothetical protein